MYLKLSKTTVLCLSSSSLYVSPQKALSKELGHLWNSSHLFSFSQGSQSVLLVVELLRWFNKIIAGELVWYQLLYHFQLSFLALTSLYVLEF